MIREQLVLNPFFNFLSRSRELLFFSTMRKDTRSEVRKIKKGDPTKYPPFADKFKLSYRLLSELLLAPLRIDLGGFYGNIFTFK